MRRLLSVALWSAIAAAFVGPGTVTTCASAGARYGTALSWALLFSLVACYTLQEASARLTARSGLELGGALARRSGAAGVGIGALALAAVLIGCAAYEAGNVLGAVAGLERLGLKDRRAGACGVVALSGLVLALAAVRTAARLLAIVVAAMGLAFAATAMALDRAALAAGALRPGLPPESAPLALGLVGTTVVPYNLFLGSRLARGERVEEIRFGLAAAVAIGGLISLAILWTGTAVRGPFAFEALQAVLERRLGGWAGPLFAWGLFCAGFSSAVTAPLAAAITAATVLGRPGRDARWEERGWRFRSVWLGVLICGLGFGLAGVPPVPVIVAAQALNGLLLPLVAAFLWVETNDPTLLGRESTNGILGNGAMGLTVAASALLGSSALLGAAARISDFTVPDAWRFGGSTALAAAFVGWSGWRAYEVRRGAP